MGRRLAQNRGKIHQLAGKGLRLKYLSPSFVFPSMTVSIMPDAKKRNIATLVKEYGKRLFAFVRGRVGTREDAEDILQDVWYQLGNLANLDDLENAGSWPPEKNRFTRRYCLRRRGRRVPVSRIAAA